MNKIVGMMWNKNEGDILEEIIAAALPKLDSIFIADDGSTDRSWEIIKFFKERRPDKVEYIQRNPSRHDPAQRQSLLNTIRLRYKPESTWVQVVESDVILLDTNIHYAIENHSDSHNLAVSWQTLNAVRKVGTWKAADEYPNWSQPIQKVMPYAHYMEVMTYTFRPLPALGYTAGRWRPWPNGWSNYTKDDVKNSRKSPDSPLIAHYGYRGPTHFYNKYKHMGNNHTRYKNWKLTNVNEVEATVAFFNGAWNTNPIEMSREGWKKWLEGRNINKT